MYIATGRQRFWSEIGFRGAIRQIFRFANIYGAAVNRVFADLITRC